MPSPTSNSSLDTPQGVLKRAAGLSIGSAVAMIVLGVLAMVLPGATSIGVAILMSLIVIFAGAAHSIYAFAAERAGQVVWHLVIGLVYIAGGIYLAVHPALSVVTLTLVLGAMFVAEGVTRIAVYFQARALPGAGWILFDGITTLLLGGVIMWRWPGDSAWAIGTLVGVNLLVSGVARLMVSVAARRAVDAAAYS